MYTENLPASHWKKFGLQWFAGKDMDYLTDEMLGVRQEEIQTYKDASQELYELYERAAQHVVDKKLWYRLGIPSNAVRLIEYTWENRHQHLHLYGRFDLAGVIDGKTPKLIEFNADTATVMPETSVVQQEQLKAANMAMDQQFNQLDLYLSAQFRRLAVQNPHKSPQLLLSTLGHEEDNLNADVVARAAAHAGFEIRHMRLDKVVFSPDEGIFIQVGRDEYLPFDFWFKLIPWEFIALEEPELMDILSKIVLNDLAVIVNPAYTMLLQSKGMMAVLWELFPNHPLLLKTTTSVQDFRREAYVQKVIFGREGENINILDEHSHYMGFNKGDFGNFPSIFQAFEELPSDRNGEYYQAGVYWSGQPAALSFRRRDGYIIDADSEFISHYILAE